jgi:hypothetical protein
MTAAVDIYQQCQAAYAEGEEDPELRRRCQRAADRYIELMPDRSEANMKKLCADLLLLLGMWRLVARKNHAYVSRLCLAREASLEDALAQCQQQHNA